MTAHMAGTDVSHLIKQELARRRMSRASLANAAKVSLSALEKGLSGRRKFSDTTLLRIEQVIDVSLRSDAAATLTAPDELGGYARASVTWLEGNYLTLRPSFTRAQDIYAYVTDVTWDDVRHHLVFRELARLDAAYAQKGDVAVPHQTGHIYFSTNRHGQQRLMTMKRMARTSEMFGLLLTLQQEKGAHLKPVAMPVAMLPVAGLKVAPSLGMITPAHKAHDDYARVLRGVLQEGFAGMLGV
jgi:transcriptional regulator with XRE-family HTH domain